MVTIPSVIEVGVTPRNEAVSPPDGAAVAGAEDEAAEEEEDDADEDEDDDDLLLEHPTNVVATTRTNTINDRNRITSPLRGPRRPGRTLGTVRQAAPRWRSGRAGSGREDHPGRTPP